MKVLSTRQFIFLSVFIFVSTKVLTLQPFVFEYAGKDAIWSIFSGTIIDFIILFAVLFIIKKYENLTLVQFLEKFFGKIITKILLCLLFLFILLKTVFLYQETHSLFTQILYEDFSIIPYIVPAFFVTGYLAIKGIDTIARSMEILGFFVLFGVLVCAGTALGGFETGGQNILPFFENGIGPCFDGLWGQIFYRGNMLILLCFMGRIKFNKKFSLKVIGFNALFASIILAITLLFYMIYGQSARYVEFALADLPQYDPFVSDLGRFNWLSVVVCTIALFLTSSALLYCMGLLGRWVLGLKRSIIPVGIVVSLLALLGFVHQFSLIMMRERIVQEWRWIIFIVGLLFFLICLGVIIFGRFKKWKKQ